MNKLLLGIVLGILIVTGTVIWLVPPLTYDALPFLWTGHHKKLIQERADELLDSLAKDDTEAAIRLTDPNLVVQRGTQFIGVQFKVLRVWSGWPAAATFALTKSSWRRTLETPRSSSAFAAAQPGSRLSRPNGCAWQASGTCLCERG